MSLTHRLRLLPIAFVFIIAFCSFIAPLLLRAQDATAPKIRTWTDSQGRKINAALLKVDGDNITFSIKGREVPYQLSKLSDEDQKFIAQWLDIRNPKPLVNDDGSFTIGEDSFKAGDIFTTTLKANDEDRRIADADDLEGIMITIATPADFDPSKSYPIFVTSTTTSATNAVAAKGNYARVGTPNGFIVIGAQSTTLDIKKHTYHEARAATFNRLIKEMVHIWPASKDWPLYFGGFSGGSKNCFFLAGYSMKELKRPPLGFFMIGSNYSLLDTVRKEYNLSKSDLKHVLYYVCNGTQDKIASPQDGQEVVEQLKKAGAKKIRSETYEDGHKFSKEQFDQALKWFLENTRDNAEE
ncbi:MAG: hypothetical protein L3J39_10830 [Verrucomicrobiales bacterium]|nr:hypothetical protein [Verrucomicrobiales bacterium]